jgi:hypothetical protein
MRTKVILALVTLFLMGCDETQAPTAPINDMTDMDATPAQSGAFMNGPYGTVMGGVQIFKNQDGTFDVKLENFNTTNGPDLYVYLSKEIMPVNFISIAKLKSTNGNQVYAVPGSPDLRSTNTCVSTVKPITICLDMPCYSSLTPHPRLLLLPKRVWIS